MNNNFLTLEDEDFFKYLEIAKKSLGGKIGNNLLDIDFPIDAEKPGTVHQSLMALRESELKDENVLNAFYQYVIDTYDHTGNYLILLFFDNYDVITKTKDNMNLDESEEVYKYLICSICPVDLSKAALSYKSDKNAISARIRDWIVGAPESAFLFPAFNDRSSDIHSLLFYTKKPKELHSEFIEAGLLCKSKYTSDEKREAFQTAVSNCADEDSIETTMLGIYMDINKQSDEEGIDLCEFDVSEDNLRKVMADNDLSSTEINNIIRSCEDFFEDGFKGSDLVDEKFMKKNELLLDNKELAAENARLNKQIEKMYSADDLKKIFASYNGDDNIESFINSL